ncbi:GlcG/HbpS family heme-binding protein [Novosphingobium sp. 9]|uniref:GlcG/HbpS family heme-binding protein n=1 Tax=Novosphingobium sp. 9 TaxID=2025349 RepID=UPI0021B66188|nr:heme-binding protein [Novosphingobium sp. 9]
MANRPLRLASAVLGTVMLFGAVALQAQDGHPERNTTPPSPQSMTGDYFDIPQSAQLKVPLGPPAGPRPKDLPQRPTLAPIPGPSGELAAEAALAALHSCAKDGYSVTVAVSDAEGDLKAALAGEGTMPNGIYMAMHKTLTVVGFRMSTLQLRARIEKDPSVMDQVKPNMSLLPGGLPIIKDGRFLGAIATSGASAHEEEKCAADGIAKIVDRL